MKKILFTAVSALAVAGVAVAADSTEFGVLRVPSSEQKTIVAVPWLESGTGETAISVSNLVLTSGLEVGDLLKYYKSDLTYECWRLEQGSSAKYWRSVTMVGDSQYESANPSEATIARGKAIILDRCGAPASGTRDLTGGFCIMGKPVAAAGVDISLASGQNVYSLIAPPNVDSDTDVNENMTWTNIDKADELTITLGNGKAKRYARMKMSKDLDVYKWVNPNTGSADGIKIPKGQGAWFRSAGSSTDKSVSWSK